MLNRGRNVTARVQREFTLLCLGVWTWDSIAEIATWSSISHNIVDFRFFYSNTILA